MRWTCAVALVACVILLPLHAACDDDVVRPSDASTVHDASPSADSFAPDDAGPLPDGCAPYDPNVECAFCGGLWHCPAHQEFVACPDDLSGTCTDVGVECFTCQWEGNGSTACGCVVGGGDGGDPDAEPDGTPASWACTPAEFECAP